MILISGLVAVSSTGSTLVRGATNLASVIESLIKNGELADIEINRSFDIIPVPAEVTANELGFITFTNGNFIGQIAASVSMGNKVALDFGRVAFDTRKPTNLSGTISFLNGRFSGGTSLQPAIGVKIWKMSGKDIQISHVVDNCRYYVVIEPLEDHKSEHYKLDGKSNSVLIYYS
ncbi:MAG: hypothetical protein A3B68_08620 [Candidatus Melainabacteria bacterium RIFCSPHIGHO2_02_FULL_34_12]|nr:MAG: hypothetical protein A3B68_08620 [Candidatus Melainabacteria bacterium RIFCSPHIGHO2_02_FULL_34_12]